MRNASHIYALTTLLLLAAFVFAGSGGDSEQRVFQNVSERVSWGSNNRVAFASFGGNGLRYTYTIKDTGGNLVLLKLSDDDAAHAVTGMRLRA